MRAFLLYALVLFANTAFACINETRTSARGKVTETEDSYIPSDHFYNSKEEYEAELHRLDSLWRLNHIVDDYSDYGVTLVYLGKYEEAKKVFIEIEKLWPGRYATTANLGTVYELLGDNKSALKWIRKAVEIDPASHNNSEWLHVKILEAKIGGDKLITTSFFLNTSFGDGEIPETTLSDQSLEALRDQLFFQLDERVPFVKPQDKIVALLLFELGNIVSLTDDVESATKIYEMARTYGYASEVMSKRMLKFTEMANELNEAKGSLVKMSASKYATPQWGEPEEEGHEIVPGRWLKYGFLLALMIAGIVIVVKLVANKNQEIEK